MAMHIRVGTAVLGLEQVSPFTLPSRRPREGLKGQTVKALPPPGMGELWDFQAGLLWAAASRDSHQVARRVSLVLVAGCVLWTSQQKPEPSVLENMVLGQPRGSAPPPKQELDCVGSVPPARAQAILLTTSCLA